MTELLPVTQADRDRVQAFHSAMLDKLMTAVKDKAAGSRFGEDEGDAGTLVQMFAAHRIAATPAPDSEKLREALTPSGDTKAAYLGEFNFDVMFPSLDEDDDEPVPHPVTVPWDTIKQIMAAIASRAGATS